MAVYKKFLEEYQLEKQVVKTSQILAKELGNQFEIEIPIRQRDIPFLNDNIRVYERERTFEDGRTFKVYFVKVSSKDYYKFLNDNSK